MTRKNTGIIRKRDGFNGQKSIVLPRPVIKLCEGHPVLSGIHITDIGYYPKAQFHYRERGQGVPNNILIYCIDGKGWVSFDETTIHIKQGEYLIIPEWLRHKYGADSHAPWSIYWMHFKGEAAKAVVSLLTGQGKYFTGVTSYSEDRITLFNNMYKALESGYSIDHLQYVSMLLWNFLATFCFQEYIHSNEEVKEDGINSVIKYMQAHINETVSLKELADLMHISSSHFSAVFKKKTGYPPLEYFNHLKIQKACQYLEFTDMHIKQLSYSLGFADPFYFSRLFSKYMGIPPLAYRRRKQCL